MADFLVQLFIVAGMLGFAVISIMAAMERSEQKDAWRRGETDYYGNKIDELQKDRL